MKEQCLILLPGIFVFRGENSSVPGILAIGIFFLFENHAKGIALTRIGIKIEIVTEYLRQPHGQLRGFSRVFHGIKQRIVHAAGHSGNFHLRWNFLDQRGETAVFRDDLQHAIGVDFVIDLAECSLTERPTVMVFPARTWRRLKACWAAAEALAASPGFSPNFSSTAAKFSPAGTLFSVGKMTCSWIRSASCFASIDW